LDEEFTAMRVDELREALRVHPFEPFRIHLTNGMICDVRHPEMALLTRHSVHVVELTRSGKTTDRVVKCDLIHVVALEPVNGRNGRGHGRRPRHGRRL
jgi:hypothetical protein